MNYESLARLIDGDAPAAADMLLPCINVATEESIRLHNENQRMRDALQIIEHTIATLRGTK